MDREILGVKALRANAGGLSNDPELFLQRAPRRMHTTRRQAGLGLLALSAAWPALVAGAEDIEDIQNVFISPAGRPFRAKPGAPYPVVEWFAKADSDKNGKLTKDEFVGDAAAFFKILDANGDGFLSPHEIAFYEQRICPEVIGLQVIVSRRGGTSAARLWLAADQMPSMGGGGGESDEVPVTPPNQKPPDDAAILGASPFSFFNEPEPVTAADFNFTGVVSKANFLKLAGIHFATLDTAGVGFLTLAGLPETPTQKRIDHARKRRR